MNQIIRIVLFQLLHNFSCCDIWWRFSSFIFAQKRDLIKREVEYKFLP